MFDNIKRWAQENKYELLTEIPEGWDRYKDGIPSVTTILSLLRDPGFEYVKRMYPTELKAACERGTRVHGEAEDFFDGGDPVIHNQIMKFHILFDVDIIEQERKWMRGGIQGTIDLCAHINGLTGQGIRNVDYKSSAKQSKKYFLQMGGYKYLNGQDGGILYLGKKSFEYVEMPPEYEALFIELKDYFFYLKNKQGQQRYMCDDNISQQIQSPAEVIQESTTM